MHDKNNYLNHVKFYPFASQFVEGKRAADIGCGSGYGSMILKNLFSGPFYVLHSAPENCVIG